MSQPIGNSFKSRIPTFSDDASIQEAFSVYHYGKDNYNESEPVPPNSIEGHFVSATNRIGVLETSVNALPNIYVLKTSTSINPNIITTNNVGITPITVRGILNQSSPLQNWQDESTTNVGSIFKDGGATFANYVTIGNMEKSTNVALDVRIGNNSHRGLVVRAAASPNTNLQEWVTSTQTILARVDPTGKMFSNNVEVVTLSQTQTLTNKTLTAPTIAAIVNTGVLTLPTSTDTLVGRATTDTLTNKTLTNPSINSATISGSFTSTATITGGTVNATTLQQGGVAAVTTTGTQTLTNKTLTSPVISGGSLSNASIDNAFFVGPREKTTVVAAAPSGTIAYDCLTQTILFYTSNATANWGINFRGSSSVSMNNLLAVGDSITIVFLAQQGTIAYRPTGFQIDSSNITPQWAGGNAPVAGNVSSIDGYTFTIIKRANATFTLLGGQVQFK
jgi:hypothetical protein